jgi:hypothetical protein
MGSFANGVHVRSGNGNEVAAAIESVLRDEGYRATDEAPDEEAMWGMPSALRALRVSESCAGWVGVLDSDMFNSAPLAADLSRRLRTFAIQFLVNDSDSWGYQLFHLGAAVDEFDSSGGAAGEFDFDGSPDFDQATAAGFAAAQEFQQLAQNMQQQMEEGMPPEVREIQQRIPMGGVSPEEMKIYGDWVAAQSQRYMEIINQKMSELAPALGRTAPSQEEAASHLDALRPILPPEASDDRVQAILVKQTVFAEEILAEFMGILGLPTRYADLSYRYMEEFAASDLKAAGIQMIAHLKFEAT